MVVTVIPSVAQLQRYAQSALNGFEDLSAENAVENAKIEFRNLLLYLDRLHNADDAVCESFIVGVESEVELKLNVGNLNGLDLT